MKTQLTKSLFSPFHLVTHVLWSNTNGCWVPCIALHFVWQVKQTWYLITHQRLRWRLETSLGPINDPARVKIIQVCWNSTLKTSFGCLANRQDTQKVRCRSRFILNEKFITHPRDEIFVLMIHLMVMRWRLFPRLRPRFAASSNYACSCMVISRVAI